MRKIRLLLVLALFVCALYVGWKFASENADSVRVSWVVGETQAVSLWKALLLAFAAGFGVAGLGWVYSVVKDNLTSRRYRRVLRKLESEIHQLRNLPLAPDATAPGDSSVRQKKLADELLERGA
jgi:uncharacterized membrane protein YciS (DUF1049 family)